ncbi:MAG: hypothetical protein ACD_44C00478G0003 [uncultured bacterium]|nr:MAG: hypothetical protein ACD_44C00478G0003 [uncultured bacterium]
MSVKKKGCTHGVLVLTTKDVWLREPFMALGDFIPTVGLVVKESPWRWLCNKKIKYKNKFKEWEFTFPNYTFSKFYKFFYFILFFYFKKLVGDPKVVVFTYPDYFFVAKFFKKSKKIYYVADDFSLAYGYPTKWLQKCEKNMISNVDDVVVVTDVIKERFVKYYKVDPTRIHIVSNAVRASMIPASFSPHSSSMLPCPIPSHFRPLAGVAGTIDPPRINLAWLGDVVKRVEWLYWVFVGPVGKFDDPADQKYLEFLMNSPRCCFIGWQPYDELGKYAAAFDIGVIPYSDKGINPTTLPVRFFTQLPYGQPILASYISPALLKYVPLLKLCKTVEDFEREVNFLKINKFDDGLRKQRWEFSKKNTWSCRAQQLYKIMQRDSI